MRSVLVVGAGFAGAVFARTLAEAGYHITVIDKRHHIAGNAYDEVDATGTRVHVYGPHLFHTSNMGVVKWLSRFTEWLPYRHFVDALLPSGQLAPLPINKTTLERFFNVSLDGEGSVNNLLAAQAVGISNPANAAEYLNSRLGRELTDTFFRPYTKKMWDLDLEDLDASVVKRIPLRADDNRDYFPDDTFQGLPADGYTELFRRIFDHPSIEVHLNESFDRSREQFYDYTFNSMPIDEYFGFCEGDLPYRSIKFHTRIQDVGDETGASVLNFTDSGPYTRETYWRRLPGHAVKPSSVQPVTREEPCDYRDNNFERYYPVKRSDGASTLLYDKYKALAMEIEGRTAFIGRCGTYQYLDMHQVINQSLQKANKWLMERGEKVEANVN
ncbi:UDP-galactopyranose mutase [Halodurantibacterium flavum]|uniref:UDP-galactopyranose mutase n=1 Tax=Halodurantibacterium flavum TaxID=1382802 RepID=A0ABW4S9V0_9RHOB